MKAFVINLDSRPDRMEKFKQNIFPFKVKRFPAIVGACGEDGCTASHLKIISSQKEFPFAVFEDDCVLIEPWYKVEKAISQLPSDWDALWLGANLRSRLPKYSDNLYKLRNAYGLHAVIYNSKRMVDFVCNLHDTIPGQNLDIFYRKSAIPRFNCFITYPMAATQLSDRSDIAPCITNNYDELINNYKKYINGK